MLNETLLSRMKDLIAELSHYNEAYYNENKELVSNYEYDKKFDELKELEEKTGIILSNSPTANVGTEVVSKLNKVEHNHPMLSLDKTKEVSKVENFINKLPGLAMLKMDGLTITLTYRDGKLVAAETRGNGHIGEDVLHTVKTFNKLPVEIECKEELVVDGEAIIDLDTFEKINAPLKEDAKKAGIKLGLSGEDLEKYIMDNSYKNARNLASGSVRQLDSEVTKKRNVRFIAWKCISGMEDDSFSERLEKLKTYGFEVVPYINKLDNIKSVIQDLKEFANEQKLPIDGIVFSYDSVSYGSSLGETGHHVKSQLAFKFYDEEVETIIRDIEWSMGRTGVLTPVAIFDPVEIEGTTVERASLHNLSTMNELSLSKGDTITVYKANMIIPQIADNIDKSMLNLFMPPASCPICGGKTTVIHENETDVVACTNLDCNGKTLNKISNFVSRSGMNINGFSKKSIDKLISIGILKDFIDIYELKEKKSIIMTIEGFGKKKVENLLEEIEKSKTVVLENFLCALGIPGLGSSKCREISKKFMNFEKLKEALEENYNFSNLEDFGEVINKNIHQYWQSNKEMILSLADMMEWSTNSIPSQGLLNGKKIVITGKLMTCSRTELKKKIESIGGKVIDSVSGETDFLINNDIESKSSKNTKAKSFGIPILSEEKFIQNFF